MGRCPSITSTKIVVSFQSDGSGAEAGFNAAWEAGQTPNTPPTVSISSPAEGDLVSGTITVSASADDVDGNLAKVVFTMPDGTSSEVTSAPFEASWDTSQVEDGNYTLQAVAVDTLGEQATDLVSIAVANGCSSSEYVAADTPMSIPDESGIVSVLQIPTNATIQNLYLNLDISHTYRGDLDIVLESPAGTQIPIKSIDPGDAQDDVHLVDHLLIAVSGESAAGTWTLFVNDALPADTGALNSWSVRVDALCSAQTGGLQISQVMYDVPGDDAVGEALWVTNNATTAINLSNYYISDRVRSWPIPSYSIAAGATIAIARDAVGFQALTGAVPEIEGMPVQLNNGNERLSLLYQSEVIDFLEWESSEWPLECATGQVLVRIAPDIDASSWEVQDL